MPILSHGSRNHQFLFKVFLTYSFVYLSNAVRRSSQSSRAQKRSVSKSRSRSRRGDNRHTPPLSHRSRSPLTRRYNDNTEYAMAGSIADSEIWKSDRNHYDTNMLYGLTLPRQVVDAAHSRALGTANVQLKDTQLHQVVHAGASNWLM